MLMFNRLRRSVVAVVLAAMGTSGCVNLPYIEPTRYAPVNQPSKGSLEDAVDYADRSYDAYEAKLAEEWRRQQALSTFLIGTGAAAIGAGLADAHRDVFKVLGLGSATVYQLGTWNQNAGRVGIYLDGMKALVCAKAAVQPLRLSTEARTRIRQAQQRLVRANTTAANAMALAGPARVNEGNPAAAQALLAELQGLQTDLEEAWKQHTRAASMDQRIDGAGAMLQQKIDQIRTSIDTALQATQADPASLRAAIQGLSAYTLQFNTDAQSGALAIAQGLIAKSSSGGNNDNLESLSRKTSPASGLAKEASIGEALGAISGARIELKGATAELRGTIDRQLDGISESLNGCGVDTTKLTTSLTLEETSIQLKEGQVRTTVIMAKGGTRPLSVAPAESAAPGLTVTLSPEGGSVIVAADTKTEEGAYRFKLRDAAGQTASLVVTVSRDANPASSGDKKESLSSSSLCGQLASLSPAKVCFLQQQLEVKVDGIAGDQTCKAFQAQMGQSARSTLEGFQGLASRSGLGVESKDSDYLKKLTAESAASCSKAKAANTAVPNKDAAAAKPAAGGDAAVKLSQDQIGAMARALGQPKITTQEGLGEALRANQQANGCPDTQGLFTEKEVARLYSGKFKCN